MFVLLWLVKRETKNQSSEIITFRFYYSAARIKGYKQFDTNKVVKIQLNGRQYLICQIKHSFCKVLTGKRTQMGVRLAVMSKQKMETSTIREDQS